MPPLYIVQPINRRPVTEHPTIRGAISKWYSSKDGATIHGIDGKRYGVRYVGHQGIFGIGKLGFCQLYELADGEIAPNRAEVLPNYRWSQSPRPKGRGFTRILDKKED